MVIAAELGLLYAVMAVGVYLTYRVLDFPDLTIDGSFTTGGAVTAVLIISDVPLAVAITAGALSGVVAGIITGLLHVLGNINPLLAGILTQIALYSINLRIMGKSNLPLLRESTLMTPLREAGLLGTWAGVVIFAVGAAIVGVVLYWFLGTAFGVSLRATGDNELMARSQGINTGVTKIAGLAISNGLVALCGALIAQYQGYADISMGIGLIVAGLASVIIGQALLGMTAVWQAVLAAIVGSVIYRGVIQLALDAGLEPNDMKLVSALLVIVALVVPQIPYFKKLRARMRRSRTAEAGAS
ncbi:ABC transporter permease [Tessaracoccus sp. OS52]|uniref:ABC transporter permease n=1 Tax=Tessaracoccus sp. OS52 TaxID=2886691 RepID=UPI001D1117AB|nr:ABC transporter permease [Tessaracoccus sp. OS52]MCC2592236.1 ABC transporter permease [Tessaracoccus sp. OS52]